MWSRSLKYCIHRIFDPNWNALFQYRMINSPGFFKNQKSNHNNYLFTSWYQSKKKRYNNYFVILANKLQSGESGGIMQDQNYLDNPIYKDRFNIPTQIGGDPHLGEIFSLHRSQQEISTANSRHCCGSNMTLEEKILLSPIPLWFHCFIPGSGLNIRSVIVLIVTGSRIIRIREVLLTFRILLIIMIHTVTL